VPRTSTTIRPDTTVVPAMTSPRSLLGSRATGADSSGRADVVARMGPRIEQKEA
jgi:hypothetical protein